MEDRTARLVSRDFVELAEAVDRDPETVLDCVIVGSGYGAGAAACTLAGRHDADGREVRIAVLERGLEYLPGRFPADVGELPGAVRYALGTASNNTGLFDLRISPSVSTVLANGVGGGSLINAGVMEEAAPSVFAHGWPASFDAAERAHWYARARTLLDAEPYGGERPDAELAPRVAALRDLDPAHHRRALITVAQEAGPSSGGFALDACIGCGDCATGCNHNAKASLDVTLLARAARHDGCTIYTGATVLDVARDGEHWIVAAVHTDARLRRRHDRRFAIRARRVILAAGALGSTEILARSTSVACSERLGEDASTNGDLIAADWNTDRHVNAVADAATRPSERGVGPTITGVLDRRGTGDGPDLVIEDMAVPAPLRLVFEELFATANALHATGRPDRRRHDDGVPEADDAAQDPERLARTTVYAVMGDDRAAGASVRVSVPEAAGDDLHVDGRATLTAEGLRDDPLFREADAALRTLTADTGGRLIANPLWQPLPEDMAWLLADRRGPLVTVHPLGGCAMGPDARRGVVDEHGRVFDAGAADPGAVHDGLVVLDGAVMPTALGTNPALTITAVALRAAEALADEWGWTAVDAPPPAPARPRPRLRETDVARAVRPTRVRVLERLVGTAPLQLSGEIRAQPRVVELTLDFRPKALAALHRRRDGRTAPSLEVRSGSSHLRLFEAADYARIDGADLDPERRERALDAVALVRAPLTGRLTVFERAGGSWPLRALHAGLAWIPNRGLRDAWQGLVEGGDHDVTLRERIRGWFALATRAGERRLLRYALNVGDGPGAERLPSREILGLKTFTYGRRANPWTQLMRVRLRAFPGLEPRRRAELSVDLPFLAARGVPLVEIVDQEDQVQALADLIAFGGWFLRVLIGIHLWVFRKPDADPRGDGDLSRLPGPMDGLPPPERHRIRIGDDEILLTRYPPTRADGWPPLLFVHGYSTGANTFAHPAVRPNAARTFHDRGRDVWLVDLRTSSALPSATRDWRFEDVAMVDLPLAVARVLEETGAEQLDVFAHCMGAAMFAMAVLHDEAGLALAREHDAGDALTALPGRIRRLVLSQVAPFVVLSESNRFRGYAARHLLELLPTQGYRFRPVAGGGLGDELLDRLLCSLPYPAPDHDAENPPWRFWRRTPWVRTRHRMDLLYGRSFSAPRMPDPVLEHIDDLFGPLSVRTISQTIAFARFRLITDRAGLGRYVTRARVRERWTFPTLSLHGEHNGLSDVRTLARMRRVFAGELERDWHGVTIPGAGHQDCLLGEGQHACFDETTRFLDAPETGGPARTADRDWLARAPWIGPLLGDDALDGDPDRRHLRLAAQPNLPAALGVVLLVLPDGTVPEDDADLDAALELHGAPDLAGGGWTTVPAPEVAPGRVLRVFVLYDEARGQAIDGHGRLVDPQDGAPRPRLPDAGRPAAGPPSPAPPAARLPPGPVTDPAARAAALLAVRRLLDEAPETLDDGRIDGSRLAPAATPERVDFALGSCQFPAGFVDRPVAYRAWAELAGRLGGGPEARIRPRFLLLTGDQVYVDVGGALLDPTRRDDRWTRAWAEWLRQPPVRTVLRHLRGYATVDDHEMENDWEPIAPTNPPEVLARHEALRANGLAAFFRHQRPAHRASGPVWRSGEIDGVPVFLMDTRSERERRDVGTVDDAQLLGAEQRRAFEAWLAEHRARPAFVVAPGMPAPRSLAVAHDGAHRHQVLHSDRWEGYPATLRWLLRCVGAQGAGRLVVLSGDEHCACHARIEITHPAHDPVTMHSIHTPGLYTPWPFVNGSAARYRHDETLGAGDGWQARIRTERVGGARDAFTHLRLARDPTSGWVLTWHHGGRGGGRIHLPAP